MGHRSPTASLCFQYYFKGSEKTWKSSHFNFVSAQHFVNIWHYIHSFSWSFRGSVWVLTAWGMLHPPVIICGESGRDRDNHEVRLEHRGCQFRFLSQHDLGIGMAGQWNNLPIGRWRKWAQPSFNMLVSRKRRESIIKHGGSLACPEPWKALPKGGQSAPRRVSMAQLECIIWNTPVKYS